MNRHHVVHLPYLKTMLNYTVADCNKRGNQKTDLYWHEYYLSQSYSGRRFNYEVQQ